MIFNSIEFGIFLPLVFILYWFVTNKNLRAQNLLILIASYIFYGWWDWRFLSLIAFSTIVDYTVGLQLSTSESVARRRFLLWISIVVNIGFLGFFKYYNFFVDNFVEAFTLFGRKLEVSSLRIILPVGISFYTFQTLSYSIDVYRRQVEPTRDIIAFSAFVSFFPQLVAGPIERARNLLPQFSQRRVFKYSSAVDGLRQILWGLFKKIVVADNAAEYANLIFTNYNDYSGGTLILGAVFFAFQIYGDFSGYSDIAIGTARLFGFRLMQNFAFPYFSRDISEFWRRWHISLSTWFRDYVYIPLGGSRGNRFNQIRNVFIIFLVSGFWHGANWTFIFWGFLHAMFFLPLLVTNRNRVHRNIVSEGKLLPSIKELSQITITFFLVTVTWVFFRSATIKGAIFFLKGIVSNPFHIESENLPIHVFVFIALMILVEWLGRNGKFALEEIDKTQKIFRFGFYSFLIILISIFGGKPQEFIYFQF